MRNVRRVVKAGFAALVVTTLTLAAYTVVFGLSRSLVLPVFLRLPLFSLILRPFCAHFRRGPWTIILLTRYSSLVWRTFLLGLTTTAGWEFADALFDDKAQEVSFTVARRVFFVLADRLNSQLL